MHRTSLTVRSTGAETVEVIEGARFPWSFRPHFHVGDETVRVLEGRARLRLQSGHRDVMAGDTIVVPAGTIHRFEPLDEEGWAFASEFVSHPARMPAAELSTDPTRDGLGMRARMLIVERQSLQTNVEAIAQACAVSAGHLARVFRRETGTSLHNFHVLVAIRRAKTLLRDNSPVAVAALDAGFYDQAHLTREFVRTFGMTPGRFRLAWSTAVYRRSSAR